MSLRSSFLLILPLPRVLCPINIIFPILGVIEQASRFSMNSDYKFLYLIFSTQKFKIINKYVFNNAMVAKSLVKTFENRNESKNTEEKKAKCTNEVSLAMQYS